MELIQNDDIINQIEQRLPDILHCSRDTLIIEPFTKDFSMRFCWSSNALEGNTLSLEETVSVIEYDEVQSGHTYSEYRDAKNLYQSVQKMMIPFQKRELTEEWIRNANGYIRGMHGEYRKGEVYIGSLVEVVHYPPDPERVPELMKLHFEKWNDSYTGKKLSEMMELFAKEHIEFESVHPFQDGNGRVGRMLLSQRMINAGLLPIAISPAGKYRRAFQRYEKHGDLSQMVHEICKAEVAAIDRMLSLAERRNRIS
ncbi:MAG: Fic family protein [Clostridiales bacterium]|nr:Fic family protein [Clostridiales bacterium]